MSWGEIPAQGATFLREEPIETKWGRVVLVPAVGGLIVSLLNVIRTSLEDSADGTAISNIKSALKPILKTAAACVTLGTGNSLGPEGPSVEIGVSIAKGVGTFLDRGAKRKLSLTAAGSAAGIAAGLSSSRFIMTYFSFAVCLFNHITEIGLIRPKSESLSQVIHQHFFL